MKCIILCAGFGTRLYPLTMDKPKALLEIKGRLIIEDVLERLEKIKDIDEIFIVSNEKFYLQFVWWLEKLKHPLKGKIKIINDNVLMNESRIGGLGDLSLVMKSNRIEDDILVVLGDNFFNFEIDEFIEFFKKNRKTCICIYDVGDKESAKRFGVAALDDKKRVISIEEKPEEPKTTLVSIGIYIFTKDDLKKFEEYMKSDLNKEGPAYFAKYLLERQDVLGYVCQGEWHDIGTIEQYNELNKFKTL